MVSSLYALFVHVNALSDCLKKAPRLTTSRTPNRISSRFHASNSLWLILVFEGPPCLSHACLMFLKSPANSHYALGRSTCAKWFDCHELCFGYGTPLFVMVVAMLSVSRMHVPPLKRPIWTENEASFHRLDPPLRSTKRACLRHASSGIFVSWSRGMWCGVVWCGWIGVSSLCVSSSPQSFVPDIGCSGLLW